jgi:acyl-CoA thioesterase FadM
MAFIMVTLIVLLLTFAYVDVWYLVRFYYMYWTGKRRQIPNVTMDDLTKTYTTSSIVLPSDIDAFLHMNNAKYMKEYDLGRINFIGRLGLDGLLTKPGVVCVMNGASIRYRRSMKLFQRFNVETRMVAWDSQAFYFEQRMVTPEGFVTSILLCKFALRGISTEEVFRELVTDDPVSPDISPELSLWIQSVSASSDKLKHEAKLQRSNSFREHSTSLDR